jgi:hypothetical protein
VLGSAESATAADSNPDVIILVTPKCALDTNRIKPPLFVILNRNKKATFTAGVSTKDLSLKGETIVIELLPTDVRIEDVTIMGILDGEKVQSRIAYKMAYVSQPSKIWYFKTAESKPELLSELNDKGVSSSMTRLNDSKCKIEKLSRDELIQRAMPDILNSIERNTPLSFSKKLFAGKPLYLYIDQVRGIAPSLIRMPLEYPLYKPTKIIFNKNGEAVIDVNMHNRLPIRVYGRIGRTKTLAEDKVNSALMEAKRYPDPGTAVFDLASGEKKTLTITVPPELVTKDKLTTGSYIQLVDLTLFPQPK